MPEFGARSYGFVIVRVMILPEMYFVATAVGLCLAPQRAEPGEAGRFDSLRQLHGKRTRPSEWYVERPARRHFFSLESSRNLPSDATETSTSFLSLVRRNS